MKRETIELILKEDDLIDKSIILVKELFKNKKDKQGNPYIEHLYYVSNNLETYEEKVVGLLHDVIEDTYIDEKLLEAFRFPKNIIEAVRILTKKGNTSYDEYIDSVLESNNLLAIKVKKIDMEHNLKEERLNSLDEKMKKRLEKKYIKNYKKINEKLEERV